MKFSLGLLVGMVVGAGAVLAAQRLRQIIEEEDADDLQERISEQLERLEGRTAPMPA